MMYQWCTFDLPHVKLKSTLTLYSLCPFKSPCNWESSVNNSQLWCIPINLDKNCSDGSCLPPWRRTGNSLLMSWSNNYPSAASLAPRHQIVWLVDVVFCDVSERAPRERLPSYVTWVQSRLGFRLSRSEVEQKRLSASTTLRTPQLYIPKQLAATLMQRNEGLLWQLVLLMVVERMKGGRWMRRSGACAGQRQMAHLYNGPKIFFPLLSVYISLIISLSCVMNDGHEGLRLFLKQYIISDVVHLYTSNLKQNTKEFACFGL